MGGTNNFLILMREREAGKSQEGPKIIISEVEHAIKQFKNNKNQTRFIRKYLN